MGNTSSAWNPLKPTYNDLSETRASDGLAKTDLSPSGSREKIVRNNPFGPAPVRAATVSFMTPEQLLSYELPLFEGVTAADLAGIPLAISEQNLDPWQTIFDQQDDSYDLYFLLSGALLAVFWTTEGREIVFSRFPVGAYFGELAAFDGTPRSLAVVAKTNSKVLVVKRENFLQLYNEVPVLRDRITRELVARIRILTERNMEMTTLSVEQRVCTYLLRLAAEHGKLSVGAVIENAPTHAEIAGSIGANREMVSRSVSKLSKRGIIKSARQRIEILDLEALSNALA